MKAASITEAKNRLSALIDIVRGGETVVITDRGIPVARLEPAAKYADDDDGRIARLERAGKLRPPRDPNASLEWLTKSPAPRPRDGASALEALLEERREGR
jgi:prevent-host-death family protein